MRSEIDAVAAVQMTARGWHRVDGIDAARYARAASNGLEHQFTFVVETSPSATRLNPTLGVWHPEHSRLLAEFHALAPGRVCAVGTTLADLVDAATAESIYMRWAVGSSEDVETAVGGVFADFDSYSGRFYSAYPDLASLASDLEGRPVSNLAMLEHLLIISALLGKSDRVREVLGVYLERAEQQPFIREQSREFAERFQRHFGDPLQ